MVPAGPPERDEASSRRDCRTKPAIQIFLEYFYEEASPEGVRQQAFWLVPDSGIRNQESGFRK
jgi:hypothetical protein